MASALVSLGLAMTQDPASLMKKPIRETLRKVLLSTALAGPFTGLALGEAEATGQGLWPWSNGDTDREPASAGFPFEPL